MSGSEMAAIRQRLAAVDAANGWETDDTDCCVYTGAGDNRCVAQVVVSANGTEAEARLIAHAPADLAALVAEVDRLRAALRRIDHAWNDCYWPDDPTVHSNVVRISTLINMSPIGS